MTLRVLTSKLLPVPHGFSTRPGGVSDGPFASLNLAVSVGDSPQNVAENLRRLAAFEGLTAGAFATVSQVHGVGVLWADRLGQGDAPSAPLGEADALITQTEGLAVGVRTADCVPILVVDPQRRRVAAVHAGWRGTHARILRHAVEPLLQRGARPADLLVAIGPSIRRCCYEVSPDLAERFVAAFAPDVVEPAANGLGPKLDLVRALEHTLVELGVPRSQVDVLPQCTACDPALFYSHRRDRGVSGRHLSYVVCRFP